MFYVEYGNEPFKIAFIALPRINGAYELIISSHIKTVFTTRVVFAPDECPELKHAHHYLRYFLENEVLINAVKQ